MEIKIIELLVKIANKEEIPKKIKYSNKIWKLEEHNGDYKNEDTYLFEYLFKCFTTKTFINNKAEIIEENKKLEKLEQFIGTKITDLTDADKVKANTSLIELCRELNKIESKINELVKEMNDMKGDK